VAERAAGRALQPGRRLTGLFRWETLLAVVLLALVVVGFLMMTAVRSIDWTDYEIAIPAFLAIVLMPFTYSISAGIGAGFIAFAVLKTARGKAREVSPLMWGAAALFVIYFLRDPIDLLLG